FLLMEIDHPDGGHKSNPTEYFQPAWQSGVRPGALQTVNIVDSLMNIFLPESALEGKRLKLNAT
ncbi:hypothetical protein, partial [Klebsiella pneumoniae]|uniref:hypothetical protein n=1 Tax=Klebsiella pneumoniae TaxID=573 RepID=UPI0019D6EBA0